MEDEYSWINRGALKDYIGGSLDKIEEKYQGTSSSIFSITSGFEAGLTN